MYFRLPAHHAMIEILNPVRLTLSRGTASLLPALISNNITLEIDHGEEGQKSEQGQNLKKVDQGLQANRQKL